MAMLLGATGFMWDYTGGSFLSITEENKIQVVFFTLVAFFILSLVREIDLALQQKPKIKVKPLTNEKQFLLEVCNIGAKGGDFTASGKVLLGKPKSLLPIMCWIDMSGKSHINGGGGKSQIIVAERASETRGDDINSIVYKEDLALLNWAQGKQQELAIHTYENKPITKNGREGFEIISKDECVLEITITSEPPLTKKFKCNYRLAIERKKGGERLVFTEKPILAQVYNRQ